MNPHVTTAFVFAVAMGLSAVSAQAGPCTDEIAKFEQVVRRSAANPVAGPTAPQSVDAQLSRQPTPDSVARARAQAKATFEEALARAKELDARDDRAGCTRALTDARLMYEAR
jgi:hypothetical protein